MPVTPAKETKKASDIDMAAFDSVFARLDLAGHSILFVCGVFFFFFFFVVVVVSKKIVTLSIKNVTK
jgi:hypothetical protein